MSFVYTKRRVSSLPLVVEESPATSPKPSSFSDKKGIVKVTTVDSDSFEEVNIQRSINSIGSIRRAHSVSGKPNLASSRESLIASGTNNTTPVTGTHGPSPLKNQVPRRSSSISSSTSNRSNKSANSQESSFMVCVNKTPSNLTPSQRLKLRKSQLSDSITKLKQNDYVSQEQQQQELSLQKQQHYRQSQHLNLLPFHNKPAGAKNYDENDDEEDVDDDVCMFNVPFSQPLSSISQREKYTYTNNDRKLSLTTDSTRASSILSQSSFTDSGSITSYEEGDQNNRSLQSIINSANTSCSNINIEDLNLSQDAEELTLLFNQNDYVQINEETRQRKKLLSSFKNVNVGLQEEIIKKFTRDVSESEQSSIPPSPSTEVPTRVPSQSHTSSPTVTTNSPNNTTIRALSTSSIKNPKRVSIASSYSPHPRSSSTSELKTSSPPTGKNESSSNNAQMVGPGGSTSKYFSFTRPTWLPPKAVSDKRKHQLESEYLIQQALQKETDQKNQKLAKLEKLKKLRQKDLRTWEDDVLPDGKSISDAEYQKNIGKQFVKDMYWRGIPSQGLRSRIWFKQFGNGLQLTEHTCTYYFQKAKKFRTKVSKFENILQMKKKSIIEAYIRKVPAIIKMKRYYDRVNKDLIDTFPDLNYFQSADNISRLVDIITSFLILLNETDQGLEVDDDKFKNMNFQYYFTGLTNLTGIIFYNYSRGSYRTFITMCNMFQKPLLNLLLAYKVHSVEEEARADKDDQRTLEEKDAEGALTDEQKRLLVNSLNEVFVNEFEKNFKEKLNRLSIHFSVIGMKPLDYIPNLILSLFSNFVDFQLSCHILDIYAFESDAFLISSLLGVLHKISFKLYGTKEENLVILGENYREVLNSPLQRSKNPESYRYLNVGLEHEFIQKVRELHK